MTSQNPQPDIYDPKTLAVMDQAFAAIWNALRAHDPFSDNANDSELRIAIGHTPIFTAPVFSLRVLGATDGPILVTYNGGRQGLCTEGCEQVRASRAVRVYPADPN